MTGHAGDFWTATAGGILAAVPRSHRAVRIGLVAVAMAAILATSACDAGRPPAGKIDGHAIAAQDVIDLTDALRKGETVAKGERSQIKGEGEATLSSDLTASALTYLIAHQLILDGAAAKGARATAADRTAGQSSIEQTLSSSQTDTASGAKIFKTLPKHLQTFLVDSAAAQAALQRVLGAKVSRDAEAKAQYDADPSAFESICLSTITVANADLPAVQARLADGEDFATVAKAVSIDQLKAKGGDNGCTPLSTFQQNNAEIAQKLHEAKDGAVLEPIPQSDSESVLVKVTDHQQKTFADVKDTIIQSLPAAGETELNEFLLARFRAAEVEVDPRFGRWSKAQLTVVPPVSPLAPTTTAPKAGS